MSALRTVTPRFPLPTALVAILLVPAFTHAAETHQVVQLGDGFQPSRLVIHRGDTVAWSWSDGDHTVTSGRGDLDRRAGALFDAPLTAAQPAFSRRFMEAGTFRYFSRPRAGEGAHGVVEVLPAAVTVDVNINGFSFSPDSVSIQQGDTVRWTLRQGLIHTVTSGFAPAPTDPRAGDLFDEIINGSNPVFSYTFGDTAGVYPYVCTTHFDFGMDGKVRVEAAVPTGVPDALRLSWGILKDALGLR